MKSIKHNISTYFFMILESIKGMAEYRTDFIVGAFSQLITQVVELIFIWIVFQNTSNIAGWNIDQLLFLYGVSMFCNSVVDFMFDPIYDLGPRLIKEGEFDQILLRPVHPLISIIGNTKAVTSVGYMFLAIILIVSMLIKMQIKVTFLIIVKIIFFGIIGGLLIGAIIVIFSISSFWTYKSNEVIWSSYRIYNLTLYPVEIYSKFTRVLITCIFPYVFASYYPVVNYLNMEGSNLIYLAPIVTIVLWFMAIKIWNLALNKYRSTGS